MPEFKPDTVTNETGPVEGAGEVVGQYGISDAEAAAVTDTVEEVVQEQGPPAAAAGDIGDEVPFNLGTTEVANPGAEGGLNDADAWQREIEGHELAARKDGSDGQPTQEWKSTGRKLGQMEKDGASVDLDEMEELLRLMDPEAAMSERGRHREDDDTGWERGRDAAGPAHAENELGAEPDDNPANTNSELGHTAMQGPVKLIDADSGSGGADVIQMDGRVRGRAHADKPDDAPGDAAHADGEGDRDDDVAPIEDADEVIPGIESAEEFMHREFDGREYPPDVVARADERDAVGDYEGAYGILLEYERARAAGFPEQPGAAPQPEQAPDDQQPDDSQHALF